MTTAALIYPVAGVAILSSFAVLPLPLAICFAVLVDFASAMIGIKAAVNEYGKALHANAIYAPWLNKLGPNATVGDANRAMEKSQGY